MSRRKPGSGIVSASAPLDTAPKDESAPGGDAELEESAEETEETQDTQGTQETQDSDALSHPGQSQVEVLRGSVALLVRGESIEARLGDVLWLDDELALQCQERGSVRIL